MKLVTFSAFNIYFLLHMNRGLVGKGFLSLVICQPRPQRLLYDMIAGGDLFHPGYIGWVG